MVFLSAPTDTFVIFTCSAGTSDEVLSEETPLQALSSNPPLIHPTRQIYNDEDIGQYYVKSEKEMAALFPYAPQALENTKKIGDRCHVEIEFGVTKLPRFDVPSPYTSWEYLNKLCYEGLDEIGRASCRERV